MSQPKSITVKKVASNLHEIKGCTYPHKALLLELGAEWQGRALCWMWKGDKLPTALQQLADGVYSLESIQTGVLAIPATTTPKPAKKPIAPKPSEIAPINSDTPSIPEYVIAGLMEVSRSARTNMGDSFEVVKMMTLLGFEEGADWLYDHENLYMEALHQMGQVRTALTHKFKMGDRVMGVLGRTGGIVQGYMGNRVIVHFKGYDPVMFDEESLTADTLTVYRDQLQVGSVVEWLDAHPKGRKEPISQKATVNKINAKTVTVSIEADAVERIVKIENLRWPKAETPKTTETPTWETKIIHVTTNKAPNPITADVYGTVAIHRKVGETDHAFAPWMITHIESGCSVAKFDEARTDSLWLRPLAETLHGIDIRQLWLDKQKQLHNEDIANQVKEAVQAFRKAFKGEE